MTSAERLALAEDVALRIARLTTDLNLAIKDAAEFGLEVDVDVSRVGYFGRPPSRPVLALTPKLLILRPNDQRTYPMVAR